MSKQIRLPYAFGWSQEFPHVAIADINNNGVGVEIAVVAIDERSSDLYFIPIAVLDAIDRQRLKTIITKRDAQKYPLWDLLSGTTLKNGMNALDYFNQLVQVKAVSGQIFKPGAGRGVTSTGQGLLTKPSAVKTAVNAPLPQNVAVSAFGDHDGSQANVTTEVHKQPVISQNAPELRRPGRPPNKK